MDAATGIAAAGLGITVLGAIGNLILISRAAGKTEGNIAATLKGFEQRQDRQDASQERQWEKIDDHEGRISFLEGKTNGKSHGAHT